MSRLCDHMQTPFVIKCWYYFINIVHYNFRLIITTLCAVVVSVQVQQLVLCRGRSLFSPHWGWTGCNVPCISVPQAVGGGVARRVQDDGNAVAYNQSVAAGGVALLFTMFTNYFDHLFMSAEFSNFFRCLTKLIFNVGTSSSLQQLRYNVYFSCHCSIM